MSVQSMGPGAVEYFTDLAREDYYLSGGEPPGLWLGKGAAVLGLAGQVDKDEFRNLFGGFSPDGLSALAQGAGKTGRDGQPRHHPGWDATFSAPKSVSVLWSQADQELRAKIQRAHAKAVADAVSYLEQAVAYTRRGKGGEVVEKAPGLVVASFEHGTSRAQDPQLHTHCLVLNVVPRYDGTTGTLYGIAASDPKRWSSHKLPLYEEKMTAGAIYRASLSAAIERDIGLKTEPRPDFGFEIRAVPEGLITHFSKRRQAIEEELRATGRTDAKSSQLATLITREKKEHVARQELFARWQEEGRGHAFSLEQTAPVPARHRNSKATRDMLDSAAKAVSNRGYVFTESDYVCAVAERSTEMRLDGPTVQRLAREEMGRFPALGQTGHRRYFTTPELASLAKETQLELRKLQTGTRILPGSSGPMRASNRQISKALKRLGRDGRLGEPQAQTLRTLLKERGPLRTVEGLSRLDRLHVLQAARRAWEQQGYTVLAISPSAREARELQAWTRIKSQSARRMSETTRPKSHAEAFGAALSAGWERGIQFSSPHALLKYAEVAKRPWSSFDRKTVLVVDSPDRIRSDQLAPIVKRIREAGGSVVLAGHDARPPEPQPTPQREQLQQQAQPAPQQQQAPPPPPPPQRQHGRSH